MKYFINGKLDENVAEVYTEVELPPFAPDGVFGRRSLPKSCGRVIIEYLDGTKEDHSFALTSIRQDPDKNEVYIDLP